MRLQQKLSVVVLCYRDEPNIRPLYARLKNILEEVGNDYEIVYVNDASPDNSEAVLSDLAKEDNRFTVITHARNFGPQAAFTSGMRQASGDAVVLMDGDLQDPPELIREFVRKWREGYDVIYGVRASREKSASLYRRCGYFLFYRFLNALSDIRIPVDAGEFSLMDRKVVDYINALPERDRFIRGLRAWVGFRQIGVPFERPERHAGHTSFVSGGYLRLARQALCSFSYKPLEFVAYIAAVMMILAVMGILYFIIDYFTGSGAQRGVTAIIVLVLFLGGMQLFALSIIAEYIGRIFDEVKRRPTSIIRDIVNDHRKSSD